MLLKKLQQLLRNYDNKNTTDAQKRVVDIWYESFSAGKKETSVFHGDEQRQAIGRQIWEKMDMISARPSWVARNTYLLTALGVAAMLILLFSLSQFNDPSDRPALEKVDLLAASKTVTGDRERKLVTLPDSSRVWLNANSALSVLEGYGTLRRDIQIQGEAFFDVAPNKSLPFTVDSKHLKIKVLGTAFNVSAYSGAPSVRIAVDHGRVAVLDGKGTRLGEITKGQSLHYQVDGSGFVIKPIGSVGSWRQGRVVLERAEFADLAQAFYNIYGVRLTSDRKDINSYSYNLQISAQNPLEQTLEVISSMHRLKHRRKKDEIVLY